MEKTCKVCNQIIPEGRLRALPGTDTCVQHSTATRYTVNVVSYGDPEKGELNQEFEVIRDPKAQRNLELYKKQMGTYK
jgi:hypothetical protein